MINRETIKEIEFPNTVVENQTFFSSKKVDIKPFTKAGEHAPIGWFAIYNKGTDEKIAEIKESICNIYFN